MKLITKFFFMVLCLVSSSAWAGEVNPFPYIQDALFTLAIGYFGIVIVVIFCIILLFCSLVSSFKKSDSKN